MTAELSEKVICLDESFSTTQRLHQNKSQDINNSGVNSIQGGLRQQGFYKRNEDDLPLLSIITVSYNAAASIEQTIASVIGQSYDNVEYIIIDGGSDDGTVGIIQHYDQQIDYWLSAPDSGIYDAMNKAAAIASGKWLNFMNAGDRFVSSDTLATVFQCLPNVDLIYGDHIIRYQTFDKLSKAKSVLELYKGMIFCHQSMFVSRDLQLENPYRFSEYKMAADFDFIFNYFISGACRTKYLDFPVASVAAVGASNNNIYLTLRERKTIVLQHTRLLHIKMYYAWHFIEVKLRELIKKLLPVGLIDAIRARL